MTGPAGWSRPADSHPAPPPPYSHPVPPASYSRPVPPAPPRPARPPRSATATVLDALACLIGWLLQAAVAFVTFVVSAMGVMNTDSCGPSADCGDADWIAQAMGLAVLSGIGLTLASAITCSILLARRHLAFPAAIGFLLGQGAVLLIAMAMITNAGPPS